MSEKDIEKVLQNIIENSNFLSDIALLNSDPEKTGLFSQPKLRALQTAEIELLLKNNNNATDWRRILVTENFSPAFIRNNQFHRDIIIGSLAGSVTIEEEEFTSGIYNSFLSDTIIGDSALIQNVGFCSKMIIGKNALLLNITSLSHTKNSNFSTGMMIPAGNEAGKRLFPLIPELSLSEVCPVIEAIGDEKLSGKIKKLILQYSQKAVSKRGIIRDFAVVSNCGIIKNMFAGKYTYINGTAEILNTVLLSDNKNPARIKTGVILRNSAVQPGVCADSQAIIENSLLAEYSAAGKHAKITSSYIGPMTQIAEGEVTASIVGPFVGMHHQSLLIAACWPEGKGNIAYGANVGSNHTGKKNDQEIWPGEGTFFGLGCSIKFPCNMKEAPYSIIAAAVDTLPQKIIFPFSLINNPSESIIGIPPAYNEILPAWVLSDNIYTVFRSENKYALRSKKNDSKIPVRIFRKDIIEYMHKAKELLKTVSGKEAYTEKDIPGLGKNFLIEKNRIKAIKTYTFFIRLYCLEKIITTAIEEKTFSMPDLISSKKSDPEIQHTVEILLEESSSLDFSELKTELINKKEEIKSSLLTSKQKDDFRGKRIFDTYEQTHVTAREDEVIKEILTHLEEEIQKYKKL